MINKRASEYANEVCEEGDNILKIYEAYEDGWIQSEPESGIFQYIVLGFFLGAFVVYAICATLSINGLKFYL